MMAALRGSDLRAARCWVVAALLALPQCATTLGGRDDDGAGISVGVLGKFSTQWPCCEPASTMVFASVVGAGGVAKYFPSQTQPFTCADLSCTTAGTPGYFAIEFDREMRASEDLTWDTQFEVFHQQSLALSSSAELHLLPAWARGYLIRGGGSLSLTRLSMGGDVRVQAGASLNMSRCEFSGRHSLLMEGGRVHISDFSELKALDGVVELGDIDSFSVLNSTVHMSATVVGQGLTNASVVLIGSEFQQYTTWNPALRMVSSRQIADLTITMDAARSASVGLPMGTMLATVQNDLSSICTHTGWTGLECLEDFDECLDEANVNGGCHQVCVNTPGSHHCECSDGYRLIAGSQTQCEDIDECALQGCASGNLARNCRVANVSMSQDVIDRCQHFCTNFEGTFQCSCDPGFSLQDGDDYNCHDLNECMDEGVWGDPCIEIPHATCDNLFGSVQCLCDPGYEASDSGGAVLIVVKDGDITSQNGTECSEIGEPEPEQP